MQKIYLVRQTQPLCGYTNVAIYACLTEEKAVQYARQLNKEYGAGATFTPEYDFIDEYATADPDSVHYYTVDALTVDEPLA